MVNIFYGITNPTRGPKGDPGPSGTSTVREVLFKGALFSGESYTLVTDYDLLDPLVNMTFVASYNLGQIYTTTIVPKSAFPPGKIPGVISFPIEIGDSLTMSITLSGPGF